MVISLSGPEKGEMACGEYGEGKMSAQDKFFPTLRIIFIKKSSKKKKISKLNSYYWTY